MTRLFLKIVYTFFLWIILLANLFMAFDMIEIVNSFGNTYATWDWSERYFGVSNLIIALRNIKDTPLGTFSTQVGDFSNRLYRTANNLFYNDWPDFSAEVKDVGDFFAVVGTYIFNIMKIIVSGFTWIVAIIVQLLYLVLIVFNIFKNSLSIL